MLLMPPLQPSAEMIPEAPFAAFTIQRCHADAAAPRDTSVADVQRLYVCWLFFHATRVMLLARRYLMPPCATMFAMIRVAQQHIARCRLQSPDVVRYVDFARYIQAMPCLIYARLTRTPGAETPAASSAAALCAAVILHASCFGRMRQRAMTARASGVSRYARVYVAHERGGAFMLHRAKSDIPLAPICSLWRVRVDLIKE